VTATPPRRWGGLLFQIPGAFSKFEEEQQVRPAEWKTQAAATAYRASDRAAMDP